MSQFAILAVPLSLVAVAFILALGLGLPPGRAIGASPRTGQRLAVRHWFPGLGDVNLWISSGVA